MRKLALMLTLLISASAMAQNGQPKPNSNAGAANNSGTCAYAPSNKSYIFKGYLQLQECDPSGNVIAGASVVYSEPQTIFKISGIRTSDCAVIIYYDANFIDPVKQSIYNYKNSAEKDATKKDLPENLKYFLISKDLFPLYCEEYQKQPAVDVSFGTLVYPFKFRFQKSTFTSNLSLGTSVMIKRKFSGDHFIGAVIGLSLSSVTLDSASTGGKVKSTDRPAITPSLGIVYGYKNINITVGPGIDYINRPTQVEQSWIYHGKVWLGFGIGINLFNTATNNGSTEKNDDQKNKGKN